MSVAAAPGVHVSVAEPVAGAVTAPEPSGPRVSVNSCGLVRASVPANVAPAPVTSRPSWSVPSAAPPIVIASVAATVTVTGRAPTPFQPPAIEVGAIASL